MAIRTEERVPRHREIVVVEVMCDVCGAPCQAKRSNYERTAEGVFVRYECNTPENEIAKHGMYNAYYPTQEWHFCEEHAQRLLEVLEGWVEGTRVKSP